MKYDYKKDLNLLDFETLTIDLDKLGAETINIKYKNVIYKLDLKSFLEKFGSIVEIIYE